jgi:biotin transporter BioY
MVPKVTHGTERVNAISRLFLSLLCGTAWVYILGYTEQQHQHDRYLWKYVFTSPSTSYTLLPSLGYIYHFSVVQAVCISCATPNNRTDMTDTNIVFTSPSTGSML